MPDMLVRNIPEEIKRRLAVRAAENGRSQSAEVVAILQDELQPVKTTWFDELRKLVEEEGPIEFEQPERHPARELPFDWVDDTQ